ncbi:MAG: hypothetical protein IKP88_09965 [Lachnospiraceae bacterium]|nr:hypothetical protein [Lachnospiraceae bacterium]
MAKKKDGSDYFRASVTYKEKHISLGSFKTKESAGAAYALADRILRGAVEYCPEDYEKCTLTEKEPLGFDKWIMLLTLRKTGMYCKNPIYLFGKYFVYYLDRNIELKFDADELFFFRNHKIQKRGGHLFYTDFGMQCSLLARYGVRSFSVEGRDYIFKNGDNKDFRFGNLLVINKYYGVYEKDIHGRKKYEVKIHVAGTVSVGSYSSEVEAAVAYNKAADCLEEGVRRRKRVDILNINSTDIENKILGNEKSEDTNCMFHEEVSQTKSDDMSRKNEHCQDAENIRLSVSHDHKKETKKHLKRYRKWHRNYIENITQREYIDIYEKIKFSKSFKKYLVKM